MTAKLVRVTWQDPVSEKNKRDKLGRDIDVFNVSMLNYVRYQELGFFFFKKKKAGHVTMLLTPVLGR